MEVVMLYMQRWFFETFFKVDKAAPEDKVFLGNNLKYHQDSDLDCHIRLCDYQDPEKELNAQFGWKNLGCNKYLVKNVII